METPLIYYSDYLGAAVVAPQGFKTDLASVPRLFRGLVPVANAKNRKASVIHDWLYQSAGVHSYTRKQCDRVFLEAMKSSGVSWFRRQTMYRGVRAGGWVVYNNYLKGNK